MAQETVRLAEYAAALRYEDLPGELSPNFGDGVKDQAAAWA